MKTIIGFIIAINLCFVSLAIASPEEVPESKSEQSHIQPQVIEQVRSLVDEIAKRRTEIQTLNKKLKSTKIEADIAELEEKKQGLQRQLEGQYDALEQIATGTVDLTLFESPSEKNFSWQSELEEVFKPLLYELKKLSERPRQIERLRSEKNSLKTRIKAANLAIEEIKILIGVVEAGKAKKALIQMLEDWKTRRDELVNRAQLVEFQLNEKLDNDQSRSAVIINALKGFITGRGTNLLLSLTAFFSTFVLFRYLSHLLERLIGKGRDRERRFFARLVHVIFQLLTVIFSLFALMATLYALSDWLLLTLLIIILVGFTFALRKSLPLYVDEVRLLLNLGPVREGERVIYNGLPWRVSRLNIYSDLVNPLLTGGRIRLPLGVMLNLVSRRWSRNEPWFPCKPNDYLIMPDETYGQVVLQTPEVVQLNVRGGSKLTYSTRDFIAAQPRNLSEGFGIFINFGLDYALQDNITSDIPNQLESHLRLAVTEKQFNDFINELRVEFAEAGASSLNVMILAFFSGEAASSYYPIQRFLQRATVEACNEHNWVIPFNQLTVHMDAPEASATQPAPLELQETDKLS
ncbi:hypothetical protein [Marinibactrum halimedae]|uniref:Mechanosensitive ion channel n=1 Tax=Marinibactrum halimedae TaxID=1444977 RepID=A0AA37T555_9GAMM|nr:hypothetical protein [Marinibactrum halimedae]MCD9458178.1 hypothetical protein [Marinibactrum halimedae]GLS25112.1 hypothetical protein GCM10007877_08260 [Marinibactrum halimedae]